MHFSKTVTLTQNILYQILSAIYLMEAENMKISQHTNSVSEYTIDLKIVEID